MVRQLVQRMALVAVSMALVACGGQAASPTPTPPGASTLVAGGGGGDGGDGGGGGDNGGGNGGLNAGGSVAASAVATPTPLPPEPYNGPYIIKQTVGDAALSAIVCRLDRPFSISVATPKVSFVMALQPTGSAAGTLSYGYSLPAAGETDTATGSYKVGAPAPDNSRQLAMQIRDHTVFKGFDGTVPFSETVTLQPQPGAACP